MLRLAVCVVNVALLLAAGVVLCSAVHDRPLVPADAARTAQNEIAKVLKVRVEDVRIVGTSLLPDHHNFHQAHVNQDTKEEPQISEAVLVKLEVPERTSDCGTRVVLVARDGVHALSTEFPALAKDPARMTSFECARLQREVNDFFRAMYDLHSGPARFAHWLARDAALRDSFEPEGQQPHLPPAVGRSMLATFLDMGALIDLLRLEGMSPPPAEDIDRAFQELGDKENQVGMSNQDDLLDETSKVLESHAAKVRGQAQSMKLLSPAHLAVVRESLEFYDRTPADRHVSADVPGHPNQPIYHVRKGMFDYYFVREAGRTKLWALVSVT